MCTVDGAVYCVTQVSSDGAGLYTLVCEDQVAWRLRRFTSPVSATRGEVTRAGFVRMLVREAESRGRAPLRAFIPEIDDVQQVITASGTGV